MSMKRTTGSRSGDDDDEQMSNEHRCNIYIIYVSVSASLTSAGGAVDGGRRRAAKPGSRFRRAPLDWVVDRVLPWWEERGEGLAGVLPVGSGRLLHIVFLFFFYSQLFFFVLCIYFLFSEFLPPPDYWFWYSVKAFSPRRFIVVDQSRARTAVGRSPLVGLYVRILAHSHTQLYLITYNVLRVCVFYVYVTVIVRIQVKPRIYIMAWSNPE
jgi:hypothetical protein